MCNAFELLARFLEEWSSVTRLLVEKIWSSVTGSGYISIRQNLCGSILEDTGHAGTGLWPTLEGLEQAQLLSVELPKLLVFKTSFFFVSIASAPSCAYFRTLRYNQKYELTQYIIFEIQIIGL